MGKCLIRWNLGDVSDPGLRVFLESLRRTPEAMGHDRFEYHVCFNNLTTERAVLVRAACVQGNIGMSEQDWATQCPVRQSDCPSPRLGSGFQKNTALCGGTLWKVTPPRLRMDTHEIVLDNDVVIRRCPPEIDEFLASAKTMLVLSKPRFYGIYDSRLPRHEVYNAGIYGLPPNFDFGSRLHDLWSQQGSHPRLSYADEQGLSVMALLSHDHIILNRSGAVVELYEKGMIEAVLPGVGFRWSDYRLTGVEMVFHFLQVNRCNNPLAHKGWAAYREYYTGRQL